MMEGKTMAANKAKDIKVLRAEYADCLLEARIRGFKGDFRARCMGRLRQKNVINPTPSEWVWAAKVVIMDLAQEEDEREPEGPGYTEPRETLYGPSPELCGDAPTPNDSWMLA